MTTARSPDLEARRSWTRRETAVALTVMVVVALTGCDDENDPGPTMAPTGVVEGSVFLDADGSGGQSAGDEPYEGLGVQVIAAGGGVVASDTTDENGLYRMDPVPVGSFRVRADPTTVPDGIEVFDLGSDLFVLIVGSTQSIDFRVSYPTYPLAEVRDLPPGRRVFTHGIALNPRASAGDGVVHFQEGSTYLRATNVARGNFGAGDSVRVVGRTARNLGLPTLEDASVLRLIAGATLLSPVELSTAEAAGADGGDLDAALVRINDATITGVGPITGGDPTTRGFVVTADDGSGPVDLFLREFLGFTPEAFVPDATRFVDAVGLLVPVQPGSGPVRWRMTPRGTGDLDLEAIAP